MANLTRDGFEMQQKFRKEKRRRLKNKAGMVAGAAVSVGVKNKDKIKKKISDIGNMKVKDAVKAVSRGVGYLTPMGMAQSIGSRMKDRITDRDKKNTKGEAGRRPRMPTPKEFQDMLKEEKRAKNKPELLLTGGQAKIAAKAPPRNKIDGKDFAVLKAEKAKGRGRGLQDEKLKPGKVTKAFAGTLAVGLSAKNRMTGGDKKKRAPVGMGGIGATMIKAEAMKKILGRNKGGMGKVMKANSGKIADMSFDEKMKRVKAGQIDKKTGKFKSINAMRDAKGFQKGETTKQFNKRRMLLSRAKDVAKSNKYGRIALGVAAAGMAGIQYLKSKMKKNEKKPQKKMGGGMMMQKPMMASEGRFTSRDVQAAKDALKIKKAKPGDRGYNLIKRAYKNMKNVSKYNLPKKMGGGMMMRPNPVGYKKGVLVKVKLGRNKPTKLY